MSFDKFFTVIDEFARHVDLVSCRSLLHCEDVTNVFSLDLCDFICVDVRSDAEK